MAQTEATKDAQKRYRQSEKGREANRRHQLEYRARLGDAYREKNRIASRHNTRIRKYGITPSEVDALFEVQGRVCAICKSSEHGGKNWHVDHDHDSKSIRGILCNGCNTALGGMKDSPAILRAAADYLEKHEKQHYF